VLRQQQQQQKKKLYICFCVLVGSSRRNLCHCIIKGSSGRVWCCDSNSNSKRKKNILCELEGECVCKLEGGREARTANGDSTRETRVEAQERGQAQRLDRAYADFVCFKENGKKIENENAPQPATAGARSLSSNFELWVEFQTKEAQTQEERSCMCMICLR